MVVKFQSDAVKQGALFAQNCITALQQTGFEIVNLRYKVPHVGVEVDAIANGRAGLSYAFEFKGSWALHRPGAQRTDTVKKAIANGALFNCSEEADFIQPIIFLTSHMPDAGAGLEMIETAIRKGILLDVLLDRDGKSLAWYSNATAADIVNLLRERRGW